VVEEGDDLDGLAETPVRRRFGWRKREKGRKGEREKESGGSGKSTGEIEEKKEERKRLTFRLR